MPEWTQAQKEAIQARNRELLVSAAAGSGKTAVLVERISSLIREKKLDVGRMLVVTFTRAAAAEMRERILKALQAAADTEESLREQVLKVEHAAISTLHVFCGQVAREHFQAAGIDPMARLVEGGEREALLDQALAETLLKAYEADRADFRELAEAFEDDQITSMARELYGFLMSLPEPWRWAHQRMADFPDEQEIREHPWARQLVLEAKLQLEGCRQGAEDLLGLLDDPAADPSYEQLIRDDIQKAGLLVDAAGQGLPELAAAWEGWELQRFPALGKKSPETAAWGALLRDGRKKVRDGIHKVMDSLPKDMDQAAADVQHTRPALKALLKLTHRVHKRYDALKREKNVIDFLDLEHRALAALNHPEIREAVAARYDAVFIDEYQDISGIQEAILQAVHEENMLFLVGDVKQSIYRFRQSDPTLFLRKSREASPNPEADFRRIDLQENFRCARPVIQAVNQVFESVMRADATELDYDDAARLMPGRGEGPCGPVELHVLCPPRQMPREDDENEEEAEEAPGQVEREAMRAAAAIRSLRTERFPDAKTGELRPFAWRDIAVLLPKAQNVARLVAQVLSREGIPVYSEADEEYFELPEISTMMALLRALDNPFEDLPLLSTLRSPCFGLDEQTLSAIRLRAPGRDVPFFQAFFGCAREEDSLGRLCAAIGRKLEGWRFLSRSLPVDKLLWRLMEETGIYTRCGALPAGPERQANLRLLCQRAAEYAATAGDGLSGFLALGEDLKKSGDAVSAKVLGEAEDVVRIMTIHKSKGLEFPAVVVMDLGGKLQGKNRQSSLLFHRELGIAVSCIHPVQRTRRDTLAFQSIAMKRRFEERAERARLLYVAMTRARERLILIGSIKPSKAAGSSWSMAPGAYRVLMAGSMLDWIAQAVYGRVEGEPLRALRERFSTASPGEASEKLDECTASTGFPQTYPTWNVHVWPETVKTCVEKNPDIHTQAALLMDLAGRPVPEEMARRMAVKAGVPASRLPLKTSVTSLCRQQLLPGFLAEGEEETPLTKAKPEELTLPLRLPPLPARPLFLAQKVQSAADRGTATHKALGCLSIKELRGKSGDALQKAIREELLAQENRGLITREQREGLHEGWLQGFFESDWGQRLLRAQEVRREWAFNLVYSRDPLTLVQGVLDLCFLEEGGWVLLDYKTDFIRDENAPLIRYGPQLRLYSRALAEITGIPVKESVLFLLRSGKGQVLAG